jgi:hypothetical protein
MAQTMRFSVIIAQEQYCSLPVGIRALGTVFLAATPASLLLRHLRGVLMPHNHRFNPVWVHICGSVAGDPYPVVQDTASTYALAQCSRACPDSSRCSHQHQLQALGRCSGHAVRACVDVAATARCRERIPVVGVNEVRVRRVLLGDMQSYHRATSSAGHLVVYALVTSE